MSAKKRVKASSRELAPLVIGLSDPGLTPLLRAGLGGFAASMRAALLEAQPNATWPSTVPIGGARVTVEPRRVVIDWCGRPPEEALAAIFAHAFRIRPKLGLIDLPGTYDALAPLSAEVAIALQDAFKRTFLQHGKSTKKAGSLRSVTFSVDDEPFTCSYQPYGAYAHQGAWEQVVKALRGAVELAGWAYPGAAVRHVAFNESKQSYDAAGALCATFGLVGTVSLHVPVGNGGAIVICEPADLVEFAVVRPRLTPARVHDVYVGGAGDAVLAIQVALRMSSMERRRAAVRSTHGVLLRATAWASQQKSRVRTIEGHSFSDAALDSYDAASRVLPPRLFARAESADQGASYFARTSALRGFVADNLATGRRWYATFATATTADKVPRFVHYYRAKDNLGALWRDEREGLVAMLEHLDEAEKALVRSVHIALRQRFGAIAEESRETPATMKNRFQGERDRWRHAFAGSKTADQIRAALADLWSRAGANRELQRNWEAVLPLLRHERWEAARDLALVALASYEGAAADDDEAENGD